MLKLSKDKELSKIIVQLEKDDDKCYNKAEKWSRNSENFCLEVSKGNGRNCKRKLIFLQDVTFFM